MVETIRYSLFTITYGGKEARQERERQMTESIIFTKSKAFAPRVVRLYQYLRDAELVKSDKAFTSLCDDCTELIKMLTSCVKTAKGKC